MSACKRLLPVIILWAGLSHLYKDLHACLPVKNWENMYNEELDNNFDIHVQKQSDIKFL